MERVDLVGRTAELDTVLEVYAGDVATLVISGEAGVGKTRLVEELAARTDAPLLTVGCFQLAGEPISFTLLKRTMDAAFPAEVPSGPTEAGPSARLRTFERWLAGLSSLGERRRVLLVVEDVHWADESTLAFLEFLAHLAPASRLLLVVTVRDDETLAVPVARGIDDIVRQDRTRTVGLQRLTATEATELAGRLGTGVEHRSHVVRRSGGNPYLLSELSQTTGELPPRLRDVLLMRAQHLDEDARRLLRLAAVAGPQVDDQVLERATGWEPQRHLAAVRALTSCGLLTSDDTTYSFRHSLVREAALADLLPAERRAAHAALAEALEHRGVTGSSSAAVALHWHGAGDVRRAAAASLRAAADAFAANAFTEAWGHYRRGLAAGVELDQELAGAASEAARWAGDLEEAIRLAERAVGLCATAVAQAGCLERLGRCLWEAGRVSDSDRTLDRALRLAAEHEAPTEVTARLMAGRARNHVVACDYEQSARLAAEALELARRHGHRQVETDAAITFGVARAMQGDHTGVAAISSALALARDIDERESICRALANLVFTLDLLGRVDEATQVAVEGLGYLRECGLERGVSATFLTNAVSILIDRGRLEDADELLSGVLAVSPQRSLSSVLWLDRARLALLRADRAACHAALDQLQHLADTADVWFQAERVHVRAGLLQAEGSHAAALELLRAAVVDVATAHPELLARLCRLALEVHADAADAAVPVGGDLGVFLGASAGPGLPTDTAVTRAERTVAALELARAGGRDDADSWLEASVSWQRADRPLEVAYCLYRRAAALLRTRQRATAQQVALEAEELAGSTGALALVARIAELRSRGHLGDSTLPARPLGLVSREPLTRRELEVAELVGAGATNRQIASRLFISERTVEVHVSRVLRKLAVTNRAQVAALLHAGRRPEALVH